MLQTIEVTLGGKQRVGLIDSLRTPNTAVHPSPGHTVALRGPGPGSGARLPRGVMGWLTSSQHNSAWPIVCQAQNKSRAAFVLRQTLWMSAGGPLSIVLVRTPLSGTVNVEPLYSHVNP